MCDVLSVIFSDYLVLFVNVSDCCLAVFGNPASLSCWQFFVDETLPPLRHSRRGRGFFLTVLGMSRKCLSLCNND